jgi:hypothetical protein
VSRVAKLLIDSGDASDFADAEEILASYRIQVFAGAGACNDPAWQAALLSIVNTAARAVHGGVNVHLAEDPPCLVGPAIGQSLSAALTRYGAQLDGAVWQDTPNIILGRPAAGGATGPSVHAFAGSWVAGVSPRPVPAPSHLRAASVPAAVLAGAIAVSECFQRLRGFQPAAERHAAVSLWRPGSDAACADAEGPALAHLPAGAWLLGLGHLGQANAWLLNLLPYPPDPRPLVLQDDDGISDANCSTSLLHDQSTPATLKTRLVARVLEPQGWDTRLIEHRYSGGTLYTTGDPLVLLAGVDNPRARHVLDDSGFPVIVDAGLGAGPDGFLAMQIRRLPARRSSRELWPTSAPDPVAPDLPAYRALIAETGDRCGVELLASRTVATAFVGLTAACWTIGGLLRELHGGNRHELIDYNLRDPGRVATLPAHDQGRARVPSVPAL